MRDADAALYRAKEHGRGGYEIFDEAMRSRVIDHVQTENDLRKALQRGELELHYQPIVSLQDHSVVLLEALLRWRHPQRGLLPPAAFIPVAEESRLIAPDRPVGPRAGLPRGRGLAAAWTRTGRRSASRSTSRHASWATRSCCDRSSRRSSSAASTRSRYGWS